MTPRKRRGEGSIERRPSGSFRAVIYIGKRKVQKTYPLRGQAKAWLEQQRENKAVAEAGRLADPGRALQATYAALVPKLLAHYGAGTSRVYSKRTLDGYRSDLRALASYWGDAAAVATREADVDAWVAAMRAEGLSTSTIRHRLDRLSAIHKYAVRAGYLPELPCKVDRPRLVELSVVEPVSESELDELVTRAARHSDPRCLAVILLGAHAGLRASEMARLRWDDVKRDRLHVGVRSEDDRPKSGRGRDVPLSPALCAALALVPRRSDRVLGVRSRHGVIGIARKVWEGARLHRLRHRFATVLAEAGTSPEKVRQWLGHRTLATTLRYFHVSAEADERSLAALSGAARPHTVPEASARRQGGEG